MYSVLIQCVEAPKFFMYFPESSAIESGESACMNHYIVQKGKWSDIIFFGGGFCGCTLNRSEPFILCSLL